MSGKTKPSHKSEKEQDTESHIKPKRSLYNHVINLICALIIIITIYSEFSHLRKFAPMFENTNLYEKQIVYDFAPPFVKAFYLLKPDNYDPEVDYPVVLALHGTSDYTYAGYYLANDWIRKSYPAFVVVPFISRRSVWGEPENKALQFEGGSISYPDGLPQVVTYLKNLQKNYSIDPDRIYITGHSAGGMGVFAALIQYPDYFAAGLVSAGLWDPEQAQLLTKRPIWAFQGSHDQQIPPDVVNHLMKLISAKGGEAKYTEYIGLGHGIWDLVYENNAVWDWLFEQNKARK